ncbi:MAG: amidohydrolase family protein [Acidimicrobiales bacterium]
MTVTLVRGGHVLTMGPLGDLRDGAVALDGDTIAAVGTWAALYAAHPDADVVGDEHGLVLPGLVNAHTHLSEALIPGMGETLTLFDWAPAVIVPASLQVDREMARVGALLKGIELLSSGVTCVNDQFGHMNLGSSVSLGSVDGLVEIGLRGVVSFGAADSPTGDVSLEVGQIVDEHRALAAHCAATERIGFRVGLATMLVATDDLLAATVAVAAELGAGVHTHLAEVREEVVDARRRWGVSAVRRAADIGLLDHDVVAGHVIWVEVDEYELLADKQVRAVYNPVANMILADGVCPVVELQRAGVTVALGTDGAASNDSQDMLGALKAGALLQKVSKMDPAWFTARDVVRLATIDGAAALGLDDRVGSLEPGKQADVVRLAGDRPGLANVHDPYAQLVYCAGPTDVADVWVAGRRLLADRRHTTVDVAAVIARSRELAAKLAPGLPLSHLLDDAPPA